MRAFWVLLLAILCSCRAHNLLIKQEKALSIEEKAIRDIEQKKPNLALKELYSLFTASELAIINDPNQTPSSKAAIIFQELSKHKNKDNLLSLFSLATVDASGIDILKLSVLLADNRKVDPQKMIQLLIDYLPKSPALIDSLDIVTIVGQLTDSKSKTVACLTYETVVSLLGIAARIIALDPTNSRVITEADMAKLSDKDATSINELLLTAQGNLEAINKKTEDDTYKSILSKINNMTTLITQSPGANSQTKIKNYFAKLLTNGSPISIDALLANGGNSIIVHDSDSRLSPEKTKKNAKFSALKDKKEFYLGQIVTNDNGWVKDTTCDALLFNSLFNIGGGKTDITIASDTHNRWYRDANHTCYDQKLSGSTISRDMLMGLGTWILVHKDKTTLNNLIAYGESHKNSTGDWIMGDGDPNSVKVDTDTQLTFYILLDYLNGNPIRALADHVWFLNTGYQAHIEILEFFIRASVLGGVTQAELELLKQFNQKEPHNALFSAMYHHYSDGDMNDAVNLLLNTKYFPDDRLPNSKDRCEFYLWQRAEMEGKKLSSDWSPCNVDNFSTFSAIDFLFVNYLIQEAF